MKFYALPASGQPIYLRELLRLFTRIKSPVPFTERLFPDESSVTVSSGSAALLLAFRALKRTSKRREVVLPAYTCPSVLAGALNAGLHPRLCDFEYPLLQMDLDQLETLVGPDTLAIVAVHLYGTQERVKRLKDIAKSCGAFLVEDSAQLFRNTADLSTLDAFEDRQESDPQQPATAFGDLVIVSYGRGKPITLLSGGGVRILNPKLVDPIRAEYARMAEPSTFTKIIYAIKLPLYSLLFPPNLFWIPNSIPFLKIGTTTFTLQVSYRRSNPLADRLGATMPSRLAQLTETRKNLSSLYAEKLEAVRRHLDYMPQDDAHDALLRFPIIFRSADHRDQCLSALNREGLGASPSYPAPLNELNGKLRQMFGGNSYPQAHKLSKRILTLPIHEYVRTIDVCRMNEIIFQIACGH